MNQPTLLAVRILFVSLCAIAGGLSSYFWGPLEGYTGLAVFMGICIGMLVVLVDILLKGFSLRGLTALTFGLFIGMVISGFLSHSPLFAYGDPEMIYIFRLVLFVVCTYWATVIALRGKDEFHLVIPYVRFTPQHVDAPVMVLDASCLVDGRILRLAASNFLTATLIVPQFVVSQMHRLADSMDPGPKARGRKGLRTLNELRGLPSVEMRVEDSALTKGQRPQDKLLFIAKSLRGRIITNEYNLAQLAQFQGITCVLVQELMENLKGGHGVGDIVHIELCRPGKEPDQSLGYLEDGTMVVVPGGRSLLGSTQELELTSMVPSSSGRVFFARVLPSEASTPHDRITVTSSPGNTSGQKHRAILN